MKLLNEFKKFALKGNIIDMAVGVIVGGAFGKIVTSLVNDLIMPLISLATGQLDFQNMFIALDGKTYKTLEEAKAVGAATLNYGNFITVIIDFMIIAISIFLVIRQINIIQEKFTKKAEPEPVAAPEEPTTKSCPFCKTDIHIEAVRCPNCTSELSELDE